MGALRACYTTTARLTRGGPLVRLVWYWAEPGAPVYRGGHVFAPVLLVEDKYDVPDTVGEVPYARRQFYNGANPFGYPAGSPCGTAEDFLGQGTPPTLPNGRPDFARWCGCDYRATIGFGCGHTNRPRFVGELAFEGVGTERLVLAGVGELAFEAEASEMLTTSPSDVGELAFEAEATETLTTAPGDVGELAMEAEATETVTGPEDWLHTEDGGMVFTETSPLEVEFAGLTSFNCGGEGESTQTGYAARGLELAGDATLTLTLTGHVERQRSAHDVAEVYVDGDLVASVEGTDEELGCDMTDAEASATITLAAGGHEIEFAVNTVDELFHVNPSWHLVLEVIE